MRYCCLFLLLPLVVGCMANQNLQTEVDELKASQVQLQQKIIEQEQNIARLEKALENSLATVLGNKKNIGLIYNIIKEMTAILVDDRSQRLDGLKAILRVTEKMSEQYKNEK